VADPGQLPTYLELLYPTLIAAKAIGGSGSAHEIRTQVIQGENFSEEAVSRTYPNRDKSILLDRLDWARSYCKLGGALDSPRRNLFLLSEFGQQILEMAPNEARSALLDMDAQVRGRRRGSADAVVSAVDPEGEFEPEPDEPDDRIWRNDLLTRLHQLPPDGFEEFVIYVLKTYGMELERRGGTGDEGIDAIGTAPLSPVMSTRVAVQAKRYEPSKTISRDVVALFQRDAAAAGAERAILVTLCSVSGPARRAAIQSTPNVEIIDGERLCDLVLEQGIGIVTEPRVVLSFFDRFD
jgi:restriction system protein